MKNTPARQHLLSIDDVDLAVVRAIEEQADRHESLLRRPPPQARIVGLRFDQRSTRTQFGFEAAALRLGHKVMHVGDARLTRHDGEAASESLEDHIRTCDAFVDAYVVRSPVPGLAARIARTSIRPVVNAGDVGPSQEHPTQALVDRYAMTRLTGRPMKDLDVGLSGDLRARSMRSFLKLIALEPPRRLTIVAPDGRAPDLPPGAAAALAAAGTAVRAAPTAADALDCDVLSMITPGAAALIDEGGPRSGVEAAERIKANCPAAYRIEAADILKRKSKTLILNPMPRHDEIAADVDPLPNAGWLRQVELSNRVRLAVLARVLSARPWSVSVPMAAE